VSRGAAVGLRAADQSPPRAQPSSVMSRWFLRDRRRPVGAAPFPSCACPAVPRSARQPVVTAWRRGRPLAAGGGL